MAGTDIGINRGQWPASIAILAIVALLAGCAGSRVGLKEEAVASPALPDSAARATAMDHYLAGTLALEAGDIAKTALEYQLAWLFDPSSVTIPQALAKTYLRLGERQAAVIVLEKALAAAPDTPELLAALADMSLRSGNLAGSSNYYRKLSQERPLDREEMLRQIMLLERSGKSDDALHQTKEYLRRFPPDPVIYERIGLIQIGKRDFEAADTAFRKLIELDPSNDRILFVLGGFCVAREDWLGAEQFFRRAIEQDSTEFRYWTNLLMVVGEQRKDEMLRDLLDLAIGRFPDQPLLYDSRAGLRERRGDLDSALADARQSIALDSSRVSPYLAIGYVHHQRKEWRESARVYDKAMALEPDNPMVLNNYAYMLSVQGARLDEALQMVEKALAASPNNASYHDTRGWVLYRMGRPEEALREVDTALKSEQNNAELFEHLGYIYDALGRATDAKDAWRKASRLAPDNPEYQRLAR